MGRRREGEGVYQTSSVKIYCLVCKFAHSLTHLYTTEQDMGREGGRLHLRIQSGYIHCYYVLYVGKLE